MRARRHRRARGQSITELALVLPLLMLLVLGVSDLARAYNADIEVTGASRAGARAGIIADTADIGDAVRSEPNSAIPNSVAAWGDTGPGQPNAVCTTGGSGPTHCGDPNGCPASVFTATRIACFAIRPCTLQATAGHEYTCATYGSWGYRPVQGSNQGDGLQVLVRYRFQPATLEIAGLVGGGIFYLTGSTTALELYY